MAQILLLHFRRLQITLLVACLLCMPIVKNFRTSVNLHHAFPTPRQLSVGFVKGFKRITSAMGLSITFVLLDHVLRSNQSHSLQLNYWRKIVSKPSNRLQNDETK